MLLFFTIYHETPLVVMSSTTKSRWVDNLEDALLERQRKAEKEAKKRAKVERQRKIEGAQQIEQQREDSTRINGHHNEDLDDTEHNDRPAKRRRLSEEPERERNAEQPPTKLLRFPTSEWGPCRHVDNFEKLNHIEEGSYGWVSRARETATGEVVALKKLKMDNSNDGFPVTGLREIQTLMESRHTNIVNLREVVMGDKMDE